MNPVVVLSLSHEQKFNILLIYFQEGKLIYHLSDIK